MTRRAITTALYFSVVSVLLSAPIVSSLKHTYRTSNDQRTLIGPLGFPFGFTNTGFFNLTVFDFDISVASALSDSAISAPTLEQIGGVGFLLLQFKNEGEFIHYLNYLSSNDTNCALAPFLEDQDSLDFEFGMDDDDTMSSYAGNGQIVDSIQESGLFLDMSDKDRWHPHTAHTFWEFSTGEGGLYFLLFQICHPPPNLLFHTKFELDIQHSNIDIFKRESYLSAGEMILPIMFFYFAVLYGICLALWVSNIRLIGEGNTGHFDQDLPGQPIVYPIHHLMSVLLTLKFLAIFFESIRYHFLRVTGHAQFWSGIYYTFAFLKGSFLFTLILLLGSGWSFVKPFLSDREKNIACVVLGLQVINNLAIVVLTQQTEGERSFDRWTIVLHLVDILCCCAVLLPIVWHVNSLEKNLEQSANHGNDNDGDNDEVVNLQDDVALPEDEFEELPDNQADLRLTSKLKLFRNFYLLVVGYIYSTRILIYLFTTTLDYRHTWLRHFVIEAVTIIFYILVGMQFRPMPENPYLSLRKEPENEVVEVELPTKSQKLQD